MIAIRTSAVVIVLLVGFWAATPAAGPPPRQDFARWVEDLASEEPEVWRPAVERLWKAGKAAEPALRAAMKHPDADVVLRARLVLSRVEWGIYPDTPAATVAVIERFRDGNPVQRRGVVDELVKQGRSGYILLQRLAARESDATIRQHITDTLKRNCRPILRDLLASGDRAGAVELLEGMAAGGSDEAARDLAALWVLTGQAVKAAALERQAAGDQKAALLGAYLHRSNGDLRAARRLAEKAGNAELLAGIVDEQEDFKTLVRLAPADLQTDQGKWATVLHHAGDKDGFEAALARIPVNQTWTQTVVLYFNDRPRQGIDADRKAGRNSSACKLLALQGRRKEALALSAESETKVPEQRVGLLLELAVLSRNMGEKEKAGDLLRQALEAIEKLPASADGLLAGVVRAGDRMNERKDALERVGRALDRINLPLPPSQVLGEVSKNDSATLLLWWNFLRRRPPAALPSETLARLRGWFEQGKADKDFDALLTAVQALPPAEKEQWDPALVRTCRVVGKSKKAEEILKAATQTVLKTAAAHLALAEFYFERKQWAEAEAEFGKALERDRGNAVALYLRGAALKKAGRGAEGIELQQRARLLPLADEAARYTLAQALDKHGLAEEGHVEWLILSRTAPFRSIYATNAFSGLAAKAVRDKRNLEAARYYRRVYLNLVLGRGAFLDETAYLRVPGWARLYQARGLIDAGKLDAALEEGKRVLEYLPEEGGLVIDLVRALDRAKRKMDADRLFDGMFARLEKACEDAPKSSDCHNRLGWLAARCGRQLDRAVKHQRTATTLAPDSAGVLDTLAEIHFQAGNQAEAVRVMKRAIKLAPDRPYFAAQLRRIEAGDRDAALPPE